MKKPKTEGTGNNISKALKGRIISKEWNIKRSSSKMKSIIQYDKNKKYSSIKLFDIAVYFFKKSFNVIIYNNIIYYIKRI